MEKQMREELYFKALGNNCLMEVKGKFSQLRITGALKKYNSQNIL